MNRVSRLLTLIAGLVLCQFAWAGEVVAILSASGKIQIGPDGKVLSHQIDVKVPASVAEAISRNLATWTFEPILEDGRPVIAETRVNLSIEAVEHSADEVALRLKRVWFGDEAIASRTKSPSYPIGALQRGIQAQVTVALRLDEEGRVVEAHPYQTRFATDVNPRLAKRYRASFERATLKAAREWQYSADISRPGGVTLLAPITYSIGVDGRMDWLILGEGEIVPPPWPMDGPMPSDIEALPNGGAMLADQRIRLTRDPVGPLL
jgi:hypothetical protein